MRVDALIARTGVQIYRDAEGREFREYRPKSEVHNPDSLESFASAVVTDDHPPTMVTASNRRDYQRGMLEGAPRPADDGRHVMATLVIDSDDLIGKMKRGKLEVSNGYTCDLDMTPGTSPEGEKYDAVQRNIRGNHVAIVDRGRAGSARARLDGLDAGAAHQVSDSADVPSGSNLSLRNDGASVMDLTQALAALAAAQKDLGGATAEREANKARADKAEGERDAHKARADKAEGERDAEKTRADKSIADATKARTDAADAMPALVQARVDLEIAARAILGEDADAKIKGKTDRDVKAAVVEKVLGTKLDGKADGYVDGQFDAAMNQAKADAAAQAKTGEQLGGARATVDATRKADAANKTDAETTARNKMITDAADAWKAKS